MFHIVYITDESYVLPTKASITSLVRSVQNTPVTVHVIAVDVSRKSRLEIAALQGGTVSIECLCAENDSRGLQVQHAYVSKAALLKLNLAELFPELDTILFLDGDTLVSPGFLDIFGTDIGNAYVAAVMDLFSMRLGEWHRKLGLERYFNSGVMLLNLKKMREDGIAEKLWAELLRPDYNNLYMEQNALNSVFGPNVVYLSVKYNFFEPKFTTELTPEDVIAFYNVPEADFRHPVIRHIAGSVKPWKSATLAISGDWIGYVQPEDFLKVARNYCVTLADAYRKGLADLRGECKKDVAAQNAARASEAALQRKALKVVQGVVSGNAAVPYRLGENIISGKTDGVVLEGFHDEEEWGRWCALSCRVLVSSTSFQKVRGELHLRMFLHSFHTTRKMQIRLDGELIREFQIPVKDVLIDKRIDPPLIKRDLSIEISADGPEFSMSDLGKGEDERKLAFAIKYMILFEDPSPYFTAQQKANSQRDALQRTLDGRLTQLEKSEAETTAALAGRLTQLEKSEAETAAALAERLTQLEKDETKTTAALAERAARLEQEFKNELSALQNAVHVIHLSVGALYSSHSYRIGRAITFLPRKIWHLFRR